jgi:protein-S-isoprenylcysteine O-methyltransferase Ste14
MTPLAYRDAAAMVAFYVVLASFGVSEWRIRLRSRLNRGGTRHDRGSLYVVVVTSLLGVAGAFVIAAHVRSAGVTVARWPIFVGGLVIVVLGMALRQWAVRSLGQFFTVQVQVRSGQTVVDTGPYRWVRHPSYTAIIVSFAGIGVALENWLSLIVLLIVPTIGLVIRIRVEERTLLTALGEPYRQFSSSRARLIPGIW